MDRRPLTDRLHKLLARRLHVGRYWTLTAPGPLLVAASILLLGLVALWLKREATIVADGHLILWSPDSVVMQVRILGYDFFMDTSATRLDTVTSLGLAILAGITLVAALLLRGWTPAPRRTSRAFAIAAAALLVAALDEGLAIHETVALNVAFLRALPFVDHPDDVLMGVYVLGVLAFAWIFRDLVRPFRSAKLWMGAGIVQFVVAQLIDFLPTEAFAAAEELLELAAAACLAVGFFILVMRHLDRALMKELEASDVRDDWRPERQVNFG